MSRPLCDVVLENKDGLFHCRKGKDDVMMSAEAYEQPLQSYFEDLESGIFVDIGANIGKYTVKVARRIGDRGKVIAIEPDTQTFQALQKHIKLNGLTNVIAINAACWKEPRELRLDISPSVTTSGGFTVKRDSGLNIPVKGLKLDDILKSLAIEQVDFIKIDVEGAEMEVLQGATETVNQSKSARILVEIQNNETLENLSSLLEEGQRITPVYMNNYLIEHR